MKSIKTYKSASVPHFSVGNTRVAFIPLAGMGSYYETDDESLQKGIEAHPWFGSKIRLENTETVQDIQEDAEEQEAGTVQDYEEEVPEEQRFATLADAKEYLAVKFGVTRSNVRTIASAVDIGKANGVNIIIGG